MLQGDKNTELFERSGKNSDNRMVHLRIQGNYPRIGYFRC